MFRHAPYGTVSAISVAVIWGLSFVAARMVLSTLTPILLATLRFSIASLILTPIIIRELGHRNAPKPRDLLQLALLGILSISIYFWLQYTAIQYTGAGISALLVVGLIPILTGLASIFVLKEKYDVQQISGTALVFSALRLLLCLGSS